MFVLCNYAPYHKHIHIHTHTWRGSWRGLLLYRRVLFKATICTWRKFARLNTALFLLVYTQVLSVDRLLSFVWLAKAHWPTWFSTVIFSYCALQVLQGENQVQLLVQRPALPPIFALRFVWKLDFVYIQWKNKKYDDLNLRYVKSIEGKVMQLVDTPVKQVAYINFFCQTSLLFAVKVNFWKLFGLKFFTGYEVLSAENTISWNLQSWGLATNNVFMQTNSDCCILLKYQTCFNSHSWSPSLCFYNAVILF